MAGRLPEAREIRSTLGTLLGRDPEVEPLAQAAVEAGDWVGVYRDNGGEVRGLCAFDPEGAVAVAAALSMLPPGAVAEARAAGIEGTLRENLHEVLNVCVVPLSRATGISMRLREMVRGDGLPAEAAAFAAAGRAGGYAFELPVYGAGRMVLVIGV
ncbi:hypothetical protein [Inmirania thermothiophila]|uniref:Uncharacterized protein n=1 Tax=Inmirania thermothiophila TaxID=1750597 RepID=A0A3N1Y110_9GAMM|nr:hypothetical protein [Inmirania thermothiophila]ROR32515.1 hypothetical protein EDC57_1717 [Inmirania thermothiophila]